MVLFVPVAETYTLTPEIELPNWSFMVTVIVAPAASSTDIVAGDTEIVDTVTEITPEVTVTMVTVLVNVILGTSDMSVADSVLLSAFVDLKLAVV